MEDGVTHNIITDIIDDDEDSEIEEELGESEGVTKKEMEGENIVKWSNIWANHMVIARNSEGYLVMAF